MVRFTKLPKKGLKLGHLNICSLRNKVIDISNILLEGRLHTLGISETHLDSSFEDSSLHIQGYSIYRKDRNIWGGGVAIYIQDHIPVKLRMDLMTSETEALWLQVHMPHLKPLLVCYRPPKANSVYLENVCAMIENVCDTQSEVYVMGDLNIDWKSLQCSLRNKLYSVTEACALKQLVTDPTRICCRIDGSMTSTLIDHMFTNSGYFCSKAISIPVGCSDHNLKE